MAHQHVRFKAAGRIQRNADNDQQAGAAQGDVYARNRSQHNGKDRHDAQEYGADEGDLAQHLGDEITGRLTGTVAGDGAVVVAQIVGDLHRVILHRHIEIVESR